ncbi:MAG: hypothetical protein IPL09_02570 [Bacteroidetes bacterium]|nr:hypothetical protein [Bacteroidota bacterium]
MGFLFLWYYKFESNTGLSISVICLLFLCKVVAGTVNMYVHFYAVVTNDIGFFHWQAIRELNELRFNPAGFFMIGYLIGEISAMGSIFRPLNAMYFGKT